jgi:hypothetical protein
VLIFMCVDKLLYLDVSVEIDTLICHVVLGSLVQVFTFPLSCLSLHSSHTFSHLLFVGSSTRRDGNEIRVYTETLMEHDLSI